MKYIRIKAKYLILIVLLILGIINFRSLQLFSYRSLALVNEDLSSELIEDMKATTVKSANVQLENVIEGMDANIYRPVIIGDGSMGMSSQVSYKDAKEVYEKYLVFSAKEKKNEAFYDYAMNVSLVLWFGELPEEAMKVLNEVDITKLSTIKVDKYRLVKSAYLLSLSQLDEAMMEIQKVDNHYPIIQEQVVAFIDALQQNKKLPWEAKVKHYSKEEQEILPLFSDLCNGDYIRERPEREALEEGLPDDGGMLEDEVAIYDGASQGVIGSDKKIQGFITDNGQPLQGIIVYLNDDSTRNTSTYTSRYFTVTDEHGYYELDAYEGDSFLKIAVPWQRAYNKQLQYDENRTGIEFQNNLATINYAFNDAAYVEYSEVKDGKLYYEIVDPSYEEGRWYQISIDYAKPEYSKSSNNAFDVEVGEIERLPGGRMKGSIDMETLRHKMRIPYSYMGGMDDFQLANFLEPLYLSEDYTLKVIIREGEEGRIISNGIFSESVLYRQFIEGEELTEGDKLIDEGDMEGALHWFEEHQSLHGLKVLTSLYEKGYYDEGDDDEFSYYHDGVDLDKAILYAKKLLDREPNERFYQSKLQYLYEDADRYEEALAMLEHRMESKSEEENKYNHFDKGKLLIKLGHYDEGIQEYLNVAESPEDDDRFYNYLILGNRIEDMGDFYKEKFEAIDRREFQEFFVLMNEGRYEDAYHKLQEEEDSPLKTFYTLLFVQDFSDYRQMDGESYMDYYVDVTNALESEPLQKILKELAKYNGWFY